jgi:hypothetical protein
MWAGALVAVLVAAEVADSQSHALPCPTSAELEAELVRAGVAGVALPEIETARDRMRVELRGRDGVRVGSREVELPRTCHERATVAAVLVATWMGIWPEAPRPAQAPSVVAKPALAPPAPIPEERKTEVGIAAAGAYDGNASGFGLAIELRRRVAGPLRAWLGLTATSEREQAVGPAKAGYFRPAVELGPAFQLGEGRVRADLAASGRLGVSFVRGKDLAVAHAKSHAISGVAATLRLVFSGIQFSPFLVGTVGYWFGGQELKLDDDPSVTVNLPRWDASVGLGVFWAP